MCRMNVGECDCIVVVVVPETLGVARLELEEICISSNWTSCLCGRRPDGGRMGWGDGGPFAASGVPRTASRRPNRPEMEGFRRRKLRGAHGSSYSSSVFRDKGDEEKETRLERERGA